MRIPFAISLLSAVPCLTAQWVAVSPTTTVGSRSGHAMAADLLGNTILFGGSATIAPLAQTWRYDGTTWTQLAPTTSPTGRINADMVYDATRGVFVLFGGWTSSLSVGTASNQTWEFDGAQWTQIAPTTSPGGLWKHAMAYDLVRGRVVCYGGSGNGFPIALANTWEYDGATWTQIATATNPGPLERAAMCFHAGIGKVVLFSGINPQTGGNDTTWLYDGTNWTAAPVTGPRPAVRTGARMVYDFARGVCVLTGGMNPTNGAPFSDTWHFDGTAWALTPASTTPGRDFGLVYDAARGLVVRHGGIAGSTVNGVTEEYGARSTAIGTGCPGSNGTPLLAASAPPHLGQPWSLVLASTNPAVPFAVFVLGLSSLGGLPLDGPGMPGCFGYASPDLLTIAPATAGVAGLAVPVPGDLALMGASLFAQGLSLDPLVNAAGLVASNGLDGLLGN